VTASAPTYDLVLLLDANVELEAARTKIVADVKEMISAQGELLRHDPWGDRALAYPIDHRTDAEYHLLQFHAATPELLHGLNRTLPITDGIVRYRIIKLDPGTPAAPNMTPAAGVRHAEGGTPAGEHETAPAEAPSAEVPSAEAPSAKAPSAEAPSAEAPSPEAPSPEIPSEEAPSAETAPTDAALAPDEAPPADAEAPAAEAPAVEAQAPPADATAQPAEGDAPVAEPTST